MNSSERLAVLKTDLGILTDKSDEYLGLLLSTAASFITREGIALSDGRTDDDMLQVMYAAYLYRKRAGENVPMPRMLRYALNNRLLSERMKDNAT